MKSHFDEKEKELLRLIDSKLIGKTFPYDIEADADESLNDFKKRIYDILGFRFNLESNISQDVRFDYILSTDGDVEIEMGITTRTDDSEENIAITNTYWYAY